MILFMLGLIVFLLFVSLRYNHNWNEKWITQHGMKIQSYDSGFMATGPWAYKKGRQVYKILTVDNRIFWIRHGGFGEPEVQEQIGIDTYKPIVDAEKIHE